MRHIHYNLVLYSLVLAVVLVLGFLSSGIVETMVKQKDPSCVLLATRLRSNLLFS
jgi:hypothetical protein